MENDYYKQPKKIYFECNGMKCFYWDNDIKNPFRMELVAKELQEFCKVFFKSEEVEWTDVMGEDEIDEVFNEWGFLFRGDSR